MTVQPAQMSLMPDQVPAPLPNVIGQLREEDRVAAVAELARLIAKAATATKVGEDHDE
jgi:hypothetical protein